MTAAVVLVVVFLTPGCFLVVRPLLIAVCTSGGSAVGGWRWEVREITYIATIVGRKGVCTQYQKWCNDNDVRIMDDVKRCPVFFRRSTVSLRKSDQSERFATNQRRYLSEMFTHRTDHDLNHIRVDHTFVIVMC